MTFIRHRTCCGTRVYPGYSCGSCGLGFHEIEQVIIGVQDGGVVEEVEVVTPFGVVEEEVIDTPFGDVVMNEDIW